MKNRLDEELDTAQSAMSDLELTLDAEHGDYTDDAAFGECWDTVADAVRAIDRFIESRKNNTETPK